MNHYNTPLYRVTEMNYIELRNITLTFQTKTQKIPIFKNLNLSFSKGDFATIYGPSGKGKSTLLNLVSGFVRPNAGNVIIDDTDLGKMTESKISEFRNKRIGYIFQAFNLIQQFNVKDNIAVPLLLAGNKKAEVKRRVDELLEVIGMAHRKMEYPRTLSGGEQQRVAFARAIANEPDIILADEPTGNLDSANGQHLIRLIKGLNEEREVTVLCVSHDERIITQGSRSIAIEEITCVE